MPRTNSARRYAQAIFEIAKEHDALDRWQSDLLKTADAIKIPELAALLDSAKIPFEDKKRFIHERLVGIDQLAMNFLYLLVLKGHLELLDDIIEGFHRLADEANGIVQAEVTSAIVLTDDEKHRIAKELSQVTGKKISLTTKVEPAIMGGLVVKINDRVIDGSTRSRLQALKKDLIGTPG